MAVRNDVKYKFFIHHNLLTTLNNASKTHIVIVSTNHLKKNMNVKCEFHLKFQSVPQCKHTASRMYNPVIYWWKGK